MTFKGRLPPRVLAVRVGDGALFGAPVPLLAGGALLDGPGPAVTPLELGAWLVVPALVVEAAVGLGELLSEDFEAHPDRTTAAMATAARRDNARIGMGTFGDA